MKTNELEVLSCLVDGEPVSSLEVEVALRNPEAASWLVDCVRLRERALEVDAPSPKHMRAVRRVVVRRPLLWWTAAAALLVALLLVPAWNQWSPGAPAESIPTPDRVIRLQPGSTLR